MEREVALSHYGIRWPIWQYWNLCIFLKVVLVFQNISSYETRLRVPLEQRQKS